MKAIEDPVDFAGLIEEFIGCVPGVTHALILSSDGFPLVGSGSVSSVQAEQLAAIAAGLLGLARNSASLFGKGSCELIIIRLSGGYFLFMAMGEDAGLAVLTTTACDMKAAAYQMTQLVDNASDALTAKVRADLRRVITARRAD